MPKTTAILLLQNHAMTAIQQRPVQSSSRYSAAGAVGKLAFA